MGCERERSIVLLKEQCACLPNSILSHNNRTSLVFRAAMSSLTAALYLLYFTLLYLLYLRGDAQGEHIVSMAIGGFHTAFVTAGESRPLMSAPHVCPLCGKDQ